ncbi:MAG TPA: hypothetical protein DD723_01345 [Candidatus Omnitrophica bacterium]|nr:MAG: hypothetical protein A2Z81_02080 [Omnitrophica WOR_2 bacterium GWA2_45_18]OGX19934.1 MAG: hypothetical protein A2Y04_04125 [Omnitrophica WOR_2 bacterium GWC2_45_7]HBR14176.1 hypothetical protein [Candidatus Omnitrophota bacterium]
MFTKFLKRGILAVSILLIISSIFAGSYFHLFDNYELGTLDLRFRFRPHIPATDKIVIIEIGNDTIEKLGRFPLDRGYHAMLIKALSEFGAKAIVFDIFFSEPQRGDNELQEAMRSAGNVYLPYVFEVVPKTERNMLQAVKYSAQNLENLTRLAKGTGHINIIPDFDGKFRRVPLYIRYKKDMYPSMAFLVSYDYLGLGQHNSRLVPGGHFAYGSHQKIPLDENSNIIINFSGKWGGECQHYSYVDILQSYKAHTTGEEGLLDLNVFKGKVCLVGFTADGTTDLHSTPLESLYPAVGIHAEIFNSIINKNFITRESKAVNLCILFLLVLFIFASSTKTSPLRALGILLGVNSIFVLSCVLFFNMRGLWIDIFYPMFITSLLYFSCTLFKYIMEFKERIVLEKELQIAKQIQQSFLPAIVPTIAGFDMTAAMLTARQVGGDLYDFFEFDEGKFGVLIGDVTGKGVPASLFMAMVTSSFKFFAKPEIAPQEALRHLNEKIIQESSANLLVTLFYGVFDLDSRVMAYANGGHVPVLYLAKDKKPVFLDVAEGLPLGMIKRPYSGNQVKYEQGDIFIFYTDGITEAVNAKSEMYTAEKLASLADAHRDLSAQQLREVIEKDVTTFESKSKQHDDITLVVVKIV